MTFRRLILAALVLSALGCAGPRHNERIRAALDAYNLPKPIAEAWPEALRYVSERGYELVGDDRKVLGHSEQGIWGKWLSKGHETYVSGRQRKAETAANRQGNQVRLVGEETGPSTCRIEFYAIRAGDPFRRGEIDAAPSEYRDIELELAFVETLDAAAADRMNRTARAN